MFWPLLYLGIRWGDFSKGEGIALSAIWLALFGAVWLAHASWWWFILPAAALTIYLISQVLGWEASGYSSGIDV